MTIHKISPYLKKSNTEREYLPTPTATVQNRKNIFLINTDKYKKYLILVKEKKKPYLNLILKLFQLGESFAMIALTWNDSGILIDKSLSLLTKIYNSALDPKPRYYQEFYNQNTFE